MFFEAYYYTRALELVNRLPKEIIYAGAAYIAVSEIQANIFKTKMARIKAETELRTAEVTLECEKIRLETAKIEAQNRAPQGE